MAGQLLSSSATGHPPPHVVTSTLRHFDFPKAVALEPSAAGAPRRVFVGETSDPSELSAGDQPSVIAVGPSGETQTVVGGGPNNIKDGAPANQSHLAGLLSIQFDHEGDLYVVVPDTVYKVPKSEEGGVTGDTSAVRVAGQVGVTEDAGRHPTEAFIHKAWAIAFDRFGAMFIANRHRVIRVDPGEQPGFNGVEAVPEPCVSEPGNEPCSEERALTDKPVDPTETFTVVAGIIRAGYTADGVPATTSGLTTPQGISFDREGNLLIADTCNHRVRRVSAGPDGKVDGGPGEIITTIAGSGAGTADFFPGEGCRAELTGGGFNEDEQGSGHPLARDAYLDMPRSVVEDAAGNLLIADSRNNRIRRIAPGEDGLAGPDDPIDTVAGCDSPRHSRGGQAAACGGSREALKMPYGLAISDCPRPGLMVSEWASSEWAVTGRVRVIESLVECPEIDLAVQNIDDKPDPVTAGDDLTYTIEMTNNGQTNARGVKMVAALPLGVAFKSATSEQGECTIEGVSGGLGGGTGVSPASIVCSLHEMRRGDVSTAKIVITPAVRGEIVLRASVSAVSPAERQELTADNTAEEETIVELPSVSVPSVSVPPLPRLSLESPPADGGSTSGPPKDGATPPGTEVDPTQSSLSVAPPGGPGSPAPSTVPVSAPAFQPFPGRVPLTGSLGFRPGPATVPETASQSAASTSSQPTVARVAGAGGGVAAASDDQGQPAPRYLMSVLSSAVSVGVSLGVGTVVLAALVCMLAAVSSAGISRPAPAWGCSGPRSGVPRRAQ